MESDDLGDADGVVMATAAAATDGFDISGNLTCLNATGGMKE